MDLSALNTPFLVLDRDKVQSNERKMRRRVDALGVSFRPHVKTHKSIDVLRFLAGIPGEQKITVSTLREARYFFENGVSDIMYGVAVTPQKLEDVADLIQRGAKLSIILDSPFMASEATRLGRELGVSFETFIEIDTDGHRSGIEPSDNDLLEIGEILSAGHGAELIGVMAHAGDSYDCADTAAITDHAELERAQTVLAAKRLRSAGFECHQVSVGSTPTATFARHLDSVTELRAGVYAFQDLFQAGLGVCSVEEIALSVMTTVIGHSKSKNRFIIDAGWMAMSRDRGTAGQKTDQGYGLVCDCDGRPVEDLIVAGANQEHGLVTSRSGEPVDFGLYPLGTKLRVLPNHACATAAQYDNYHVIESGSIVDTWARVREWK